MEGYDAVIVGGGIGGLTSGYRLASSGYRVCVLEARPEVRPSKRGVTLQPNGLNALESLGLLDDVLRIGVKSQYVAWYEIGGELLGRLDWSVLDYPHNYLLTVIPSELELLLRDRFVNKGGVLLDSTLFQALSRDGDGVRVKAQGANGAEEYRAKVLVGADGENSRVRSALKIPVRVKEYSDHFLFMRVDPAEALKDEARQYFSLGKMLGFVPTRNSTYIFYYITKGRFEEFKSRGLDSFKAELANIEPAIKDSLDTLHSWDDIMYAATKRVDAEDWVADRAALMGDAVHALNPSFAQGLNLTLQDAVSLPNTLEASFQSGDFSASALRAYETSRRKQVEFIQTQAERTAMVNDTENRFYSWLGKRILRKIGRDRELMKLVVTMSSGLTDHMSTFEALRILI